MLILLVIACIVFNGVLPVFNKEYDDDDVVDCCNPTQASHWHDKGFTPWHAIWRANEGRTRDSVREDAWRCGSGEVVRAMSWRKF